MDRIAWGRHALRTLLKSKGEAGTSVILRRALALYTGHLSALLTDLNTKQRAEQLKIELAALSSAAQGEREAIDEEKLLAVPLRPFNDIYWEAREERKSAERSAGRLVDSIPIPAAPWGREGEDQDAA